MRFSVVIPAHNEERLLPRGLDAVRAAAERHHDKVEIVVVANRCTDATADIALQRGARVVENGVRNIAAVRNAGAAAATHEHLVTIDADSVMAPNTFAEIEKAFNASRCVGGGCRAVPERNSPGIRATIAAVRVLTTAIRVSGVMFWCRRDDYEAIGGFDESLTIAEDVEFARRLRAHGRASHRRFVELRDAPVVVSTRKFDEFGDWHMFKMATELRAIRAAARGTDPAWADRYFFDFNDS